MPNPKSAPTTDRLRAALRSLRANGIEMVMQDSGSTPITLAEDAMVLLPGMTEPVPAKNIIGFQSAFTKKMQALSEKERQIQALQAQAEGALQLVNDFEEDPFGTLASVKDRVVAFTKNQGLPVPPEWELPTGTKPPTGGTIVPEPPKTGPSGEVSPQMLSVLEEMTKRLVAMEQHVTGMGAKLDVKESLNVLERDHPERMKDPEFRQKMAQQADVLPGAPLNTLFRLADYDDKAARINELEAELKTAKRDQLLSTPGLGFGRGTSVAGRKDADEDEALRTIFSDTLDKNLNI